MMGFMARALPREFEVLRNRSFRLLFIGQSASVFGDRMTVIALAFAVLELGGSPAQVGLVLAARTAPMVITLLIGGALADRTSRRAVMVGADLARMTTQAVTAILLIGGSAEVWSVALLAALTGAGTGFFNPASTGLLPEIVAPAELQQANGLRSSAVSAGEIAGPLVGGLLIAGVGPGWAIGLDATTFLISAVALSALHLPRRVAAQTQSFLTDLREGWDAFRARRWVWTMVTYFAFANIFWGAWNSLGPIVAEQSLGGAAAWGAVLAAFGFGTLLGGLAATRVDPLRPLVFVAIADGVFAFELAFLAAAPPAPVLAIGAFLSGIAMMLGMTAYETTLQRFVPAESLSRVSSYDWFGSMMFYPVGLAIWGPISALIGIETALWLSFALFVAAALVLLSVPDVRSFRRSGPAAQTSHRGTVTPV